MRVWLRRNRIGLALVCATMLVACSASPIPGQQPAPTAEDAAGLVPVTVRVGPELARAPFDRPRQALVPDGWSMSVWARVPNARLAATPEE